MLTKVAAAIKARALLLRDAELRVEPGELAEVLQGLLAGVDLTRNAEHDRDETFAPDAPEPLTPLERLRLNAVVSRDFRDAGKGGAWDRCREYDPAVYGWPRDKSRGQSRGVLPWERVTTIVLHTTGVDGIHPDRGLGIPAHVLVADDATVALLHELNTYLWAAHAANRYSCSIEIAGDRTITDEQVPVARAALRYAVEVLRAKRPGPVYVAPHRFSHRSRVRDCDAAIWAAVGEWSMRELGLLLGPVVGSGRPLPFK